MDNNRARLVLCFALAIALVSNWLPTPLSYNIFIHSHRALSLVSELESSQLHLSLSLFPLFHSLAFACASESKRLHCHGRTTNRQPALRLTKASLLFKQKTESAFLFSASPKERKRIQLTLTFRCISLILLMFLPFPSQWLLIH